MKKTINILHQNIQCIRNKILELEIFITSLENSPDLLCLTEHWLNKDEVDLIKIENYQLISCYTREMSIHGGSCILIKDTLKDFEKVPIIEHMSVECEAEISCTVSRFRKLVVLSIYRTCLGNVQIFLSTLEGVLSVVQGHFVDYDVVICGDFNINLMNEDTSKCLFMDLLTTFNYTQTIFNATRVTKTTSSLIDNIFVNTSMISNNKNITSALSDHMAQFISVESIFPIETKNVEIIEKRFFTKTKLEDFFVCLRDFNWDHLILKTDPDVAYELFYSTMLTKMNQIIPRKKMKLRRKRNRTWLTLGIRISSKHKRELHEKMLEGMVTEEYYKKYSAILKRVVELSKKISDKDFIYNSENKTKATWKLINNVTKKRSATDGTLFESFPGKDEKKLLDEMNKFFLKTNVLNNHKNTDVAENINYCDSSIFLNPVTEKEMYHYIIQLKNKKSTGCDEIPVDLLKKCAPILTLPLTHIINQMFQYGKYPQALKEAWVKPIHKKGEKNNFDNYRPISLLSNVNKIFERIIFDRVMQFFEKKKILVEQQCGFRKGKSTIDALYRVLNSVIKSLNKNQITATLFLDLTKAFDTVNHNILLQKMERYGIRGITSKLFQSYLTGRIQRTIGKGKNGKQTISNALQVERGVPQGSILGPLLYIIYANDLIKVTSNDTVMYADDVSVICVGSTPDECKSGVEKDLENLEKWFGKNNLTMNITKTKFIIFREKHQHAINLIYHGENIKAQDTLPFLGIYLDRDLNWRPHIEYMATSLAKYCYALRILTRTIGSDASLTAYHAYVHSRLKYGIIFWANSVDVERIFIIQKKCLRTVFKLQYNESCRDIFRNNNILTLYCLYIYECIMYVINNFTNFEMLMLDHCYDTRGKTHLSLEKPNYAYIQKNVVHSLVNIWNKMPQTFKTRPKIIQKKTLKKFLYKKGYYSVKEFMAEKDFNEL